MSCIFVPSAPHGVTAPSDYDRMPVRQVTMGDKITIRTRVRMPNGTPATPENSILTFRLTDQRFAEDLVWQGAWRAGIEQVEDAAGDMVEITIPREIEDALRRGSFDYSLHCTDRLGDNGWTALEGHLLVEYAPTSPHKNIPYKDN